MCILEAAKHVLENMFYHFTFRLEIIEKEQISSWSRKYKEASQIRYTPIKSYK